MKAAFEVSDIWGWVVALGLSAMLSESSFRNGLHSYRFGFYLSGGNLLISLAVFFSEGSIVGGGWREALALFLASTVMYFAYLGLSITFRNPRNVKCFRCGYVGFPSETDEDRMQFVEEDWRAFRELDRQTKLRSAPIHDR